MISDVASDLITKIKDIPDGVLGTSPIRVGLAAGGTVLDPFMEKTTLPAVWCVFVGDNSTDAGPQGQCASTVVLNFIVKVFIKYDTEKGLLDTQLPLLHDIVKQVNGTPGPKGCMKWKYGGQTLDELTGNRIVFDQRYSIVSIL